MSDKLKMFFGGALAALGALALESVVALFATSSNPVIDPTTAAWFMPSGALIMLQRMFRNSPGRETALVRALFFGAGFSGPEILLNAANYPAFSGEIFFSYLGLFLIHMAAAGLLGLYFSHGESWRPSVLFFLSLSIASHLIFNLSIVFDRPAWMTLNWPLIVILLCFSAINGRLLRNSLPSQKN